MESRFTSLEAQIYQLIQQFQIYPIPEAKINEYAGLVARYSQEINAMLKIYPNKQIWEEKIDIKSELKFSYDFLNMLVNIIRKLELNVHLDVQTLNQAIEYINNREQLIKSTYRSLAIEELESFFDPQIRERLEAHLQRTFVQRYN